MALERWKLVDREADFAAEVQIDTEESVSEVQISTESYREVLMRAGFTVEVIRGD